MGIRVQFNTEQYLSEDCAPHLPPSPGPILTLLPVVSPPSPPSVGLQGTLSPWEYNLLSHQNLSLQSRHHVVIAPPHQLLSAAPTVIVPLSLTTEDRPLCLH